MRPAVGRQEAEQRLEQRRLARAVRAQQAGGPGQERPRHARERLDEAVGDARGPRTRRAASRTSAIVLNQRSSSPPGSIGLGPQHGFPLQPQERAREDRVPVRAAHLHGTRRAAARRARPSGAAPAADGRRSATKPAAAAHGDDERVARFGRPHEDLDRARADDGLVLAHDRGAFEEQRGPRVRRERTAPGGPRARRRRRALEREGDEQERRRDGRERPQRRAAGVRRCRAPRAAARKLQPRSGAARRGCAARAPAPRPPTSG